MCNARISLKSIVRHYETIKFLHKNTTKQTQFSILRRAESAQKFILQFPPPPHPKNGSTPLLITGYIQTFQWCPRKFLFLLDLLNHFILHEFLSMTAMSTIILIKHNHNQSHNNGNQRCYEFHNDWNKDILCNITSIIFFVCSIFPQFVNYYKDIRYTLVLIALFNTCDSSLNFLVLCALEYYEVSGGFPALPPKPLGELPLSSTENIYENYSRKWNVWAKRESVQENPRTDIGRNRDREARSWNSWG